MQRKVPQMGMQRALVRHILGQQTIIAPQHFLQLIQKTKDCLVPQISARDVLKKLYLSFPLLLSQLRYRMKAHLYQDISIAHQKGTIIMRVVNLKMKVRILVKKVLFQIKVTIMNPMLTVLLIQRSLFMADLILQQRSFIVWLQHLHQKEVTTV